MKRVLVTGGSGAIGNAIVEAFLGEGYFVYVHGFSKTVTEKHNMKFICCDISNTDECKKMAEEMENIDVLVNNAGMKCERKSFVDFSIDEIKKMIDVNLFGTLQLTQILLPKINNGGSIINITSEAGTFGGNGIIPYAVTKAGLNIFTKALARETGERLIRVNAISPGIIQTGEHDELLKNTIPLGRVGLPSDVSRAVLLLLEGAGYINGAILPVTGGR